MDALEGLGDTSSDHDGLVGPSGAERLEPVGKLELERRRDDDRCRRTFVIRPILLGIVSTAEPDRKNEQRT
jgi:hypothetical protein